MGLYCEPQREKRSWLLDVSKGRLSAFSPKDAGLVWIRVKENYPDCLPVVLLDNGWFIALGIAFNQNELRRLATREDGRWHMVDKEDLRKVTPGGDRIKELQG